MPANTSPGYSHIGYYSSVLSSLTNKRPPRLTMDLTRVLPLPAKTIAEELASPDTHIVVIDIRPCGQFCAAHIKNADNVNFSSMLLRRLAKGVVEVESLLTSCDLLKRLETAEKTVLCDSLSTTANLKPEITKYAEILCRKTPHTIHFVDGGFTAFSRQFPSLCEQSSSQPGRKSRTSLAISVSSSLPVRCGEAVRQRTRLQTPTCEDESSTFGPPVEVLSHLVLGCAKDSANLATLRRMGVTAVLNVSNNCPNHFEALFDYKGIPVEDSHHADLLSQLQTAFDFIELIKAKGGRIFLHCHAGISRSATVCIAYIMKYSKLDLTKAYDFVKEKRPCISPNLHFMGQLLEFQKRLACTDEPMCVDTTTSEPPLASNKQQSVSAPSLLALRGRAGFQCSTDSALYAQIHSQLQQQSSTSLPSTPVTSLLSTHQGWCRVQQSSRQTADSCLKFITLNDC